MSRVDFQKKLAQLRANREALPWQERRDLVQGVMASFTGGRKGAKGAFDLLCLLARDPRWEVRKAVADHLHLVGDSEFAGLMAMLTEDDHAFVQAAAERALDRRRKGQTAAARRMRGLDRTEDELARLERTAGEKTARLVRDMAGKFYEGLVGASVHELRGVITALKGNVEQLLLEADKGKGLEAARRLGPRLRHQFEFVEQLFSDMRTYTQVIPPKRRSERVADMVAQAVSMVLSEFEAGRRDSGCIALDVKVPNELAVAVSRVHIVLALRNLIKNAFESFMIDERMFSPGTVTVSARESGLDRIEICITDTGMGLSAEELEDVRRMIPGHTSKRNIGTGFGLPIAYRNITAHRGSLRIESTENQGTVVTVTLPIEARTDS